MSSFVSEPEAKSIVEALEAGRTPEGFERVLRRAEMTDVEGGWANLGRLFHLIYAAQFRFLLPDLLSALRRSADPDRALRNWIAFLNRVFDAYGFAQRLAGTPDLLEFLTRLFGFSQFLADLLARNPEYLDWLRAPHVLERPKSLASYVEEAWNAVEVFEDPEHQRAALCRYQRKELLRIGVRDMQGYGNVAERTAELSDLAEAIVNVALSLVYARLAKRHGEPLAEDAPNARSQFGILAMGKFGGRELNFSSDIDVIFLYSDEGSTQGVGESRQARIANHAFFTRLGEDLAQHLSGHGPEGFLYRVDVRLRPDGESGALVRSLVGFETYYLTQARLWERFAFLKARLVTPTEGRFSEAVRALCEHFVYGQPLGPEILPELADVKRRIDRQVEERGVAGREVKRGVGGIREVEFIVGSLQLLHGHGRKDLRARSTLAALQAIERLGLLSADECGALTNAYVFFRDVEHRLQMLNLRQTHTLPKDSAQLRMLARRMDLESDGAKDPGRRFREQYARHARAVHRIFERMFGAAAADEPRREGVHVLLDRQASPDERFHVLQGYRFTDPAILEAFRSLAFGHREIYLSAAGQEFFEAILPRLLEECAKVPLPEQAVRFFDSFLLRLKGIAATYAFIAEHPIVLSILLGVFGASEALARILLARPEFLDMIVDAETLHTVPQAAALRARVADLAALQARIGGFQADLCRFKDLEFFVAGVRDLQRLVSSKQTAATLSDIAEACVAGAWEAAGREAAEAAGWREPPGRLAVLAMGKLGAREMNFFSDLDLVFIHGEAPRELDDAARFHARWAQGIVRILSEVTPAGTVFKVDARLRPEGRNAPLTAPLERYVDYYAHRAQTWEFQSLLRSRWIAGDEALVEELRARVAEPMARVGARLDLANDIRSMRARVEQSVRLPSWARADFKRGRGGVVDLEFLVQYLQLRGFAAGGAKFLPEFDDAVAEMKACGLLRADRAEALTRNYRFLRLLEARSRLLFSTTSNYLPLAPGRLAPLEFFLADALPEGLKLTEHVLRVMRENRALFEEIVK